MMPPPPRPTFYVQGRDLFDPLGNRVILRGINKMSVWDHDDPDGSISFPEIRQTGANSVRICWAMQTDEGPTDLNRLDTLITNARQNHLIPMIELHDATGNLPALPALVDYWVQPAVVSMIQKHQGYLLVNIANEAGDWQVTAPPFLAAYTDAVQRMRAEGIHTPLVIDAPDSGKNLGVLNDTAAGLLDIDTDRNLLFSVHIYWPLSLGLDAAYITAQLQAAVALGYPLIVGEFSQFGGWHDQHSSICGPLGEIDYRTVLEVCQQQEIGWYAWEWGPGNARGNPPDPLCEVMDMTPDSRFANLKPGWATEVALTSPYSIKNTSVTPPGM